MADEKKLPNYYWIQFGIEYLNEPDFMQLSDGAVGAYLKLYLLAGRADAGGLLCNHQKVFSSSDLAWLLRCTRDTITVHLAELSTAGYIANDDTGYRVTRFLEEQGPGDEVKRETWRERQRKHRAKVRGEILEEEKEAEREGEEDIECHHDITVTPGNPPPPASASLFSSPENIEIFQSYWHAWNKRDLGKKKLGEFFEVIQKETNIEDWELRLLDCLSVWHGICEEHAAERWQKGNPDAIMELYPIPNLEERMQREHRVWKDKTKEEQRKSILKQYGLLEE